MENTPEVTGVPASRSAVPVEDIALQTVRFLKLRTPISTFAMKRLSDGRGDDCVIGRIYEVRGSPPDLRWFWSLHLNGPMKRSDRVASLDEAKDQLKTSWEAWKVWTNLEERD
jgi:hypothetical protein